MAIKKQIGALLAAAMLFQSTVVFAAPQDTGMAYGQTAAAQSQELPRKGQLTLEDIQLMNKGKAVVHTTENGNVYFVEGTCSRKPVENMDDASAVVDSVTDFLGGDERTQFEPWRTLTDPSDNHYYVFRQMYADTTVSGGAVKVVTDKDGNMTGLISSVESGLPEEAASEGITSQEAERIVLRYEKDKENGVKEIIEGRTEKVVLPVNLELDPSSDEVEESRFVWVVYSNNPDSAVADGTDLPYLAHYVTMDGEYLYSLPTVVPGDEAGTAGFDASYVFEFMEPAEYTGTVELSDGTQKEITVTLMRDTRTGMYYLGNIERRIVVGDCYEFLYNKGNVVLEASQYNAGWDNNSLLTLYNYCRAWDYYNEIGWKGGDGLETPMIILKDFCDQDYTPIDNAAYAGHYYGWQLFLSSSVNDYGQCLDVLAHEFTHCVTDSVMTYNSYLNDYGAINEAISDIQGNLCEMMKGDTQDTKWNVGENSITGAIRSMSDPHEYKQPEYAWDLYYVPKVKEPTALNDQGGVHMNSSLLNNVAYRLCEEGGMTLEEARAFWFATDCTMVPGTDYEQLSTLLPWILKNQGMDQYASVLDNAIEATRLSNDDMPEALKEDQSIVTVKLPDNEQFNDGNWALNILSIDPEDFVKRAEDVLEGRGECATALDELLDIIFEELERPEEEAEDTGIILPAKVEEWIGKYFGGLVYFGSGSAGEDGTTVRMVCRPGYTIPILTRLELNTESMMPDSLGLAAYMFGQWIDLGSALEYVSELCSANLTDESSLEDLADKLVNNLSFENAMQVLSVFENPMFYEIKEGEHCEIPVQGLENVAVIDGSVLEEVSEEVSKIADGQEEETSEDMSDDMTEDTLEDESEADEAAA